jgi:tRNA (guanine6-N2)-methyltransferase
MAGRADRVITVIARSVRGLEWVTADEVSTAVPGATGLLLASREVRFGVQGLTPAVLGLRTADDAFIEVGRVPGVGRTRDVPPVLARAVAGLDWEAALAELAAVRAVAPEPRIDVVASLDGRRNYNRFAVENAVGNELARRLRGPYLARTPAGREPGEPDLTVRVFLQGEEAAVALAIAPSPLHRRAYKADAGAGSLHPPLAAALAHLSGLRAGDVVADPFCGDGTIAIEAALACPQARVIAGDIDAARLSNARRNAGRAGVRLTLSLLDAGLLPWPAGLVDALITNPPWNISVASRGLLRSSLEPFWRQIPGVLAAGGRLSLVADAELDAPGVLRGLGFEVALATSIRLAGRVSHVILSAPEGSEPPGLPAGLARWRRHAIAEGVVTETGF